VLRFILLVLSEQDSLLLGIFMYSCFSFGWLDYPQSSSVVARYREEREGMHAMCNDSALFIFGYLECLEIDANG
jgi:hypothetical protein